MQQNEAQIKVKENIPISLNQEILAHFPEHLILAAYKQMAILQKVCEKHFANKKLLEVKDVKFKSQITLPCTIEILIEENKFIIKVGDEIKTLGKVILR